ncbi:MAG: phosphopyruvate hydratase, partial [Candidatus Dormiibacterota bacterium]
YGGQGVRRAVANAAGPLAEAVRGLDGGDQTGVDAALRALDGTPDLGRLGANAVLGISLAAMLANAAWSRRPLYEVIAEDGAAPLLPMPMINVLSGGAHAGRALDIQDVLVVPIGAASFEQALEWAWRSRRGAAQVAAERGLVTALVADEGGLGLPLPTNLAALELVVAGIERAGLRPGRDVSLAVDVAANQLIEGGHYRLAAEDRRLSAAELIEELAAWTHAVPIVSFEDVLGEDDWPGWRAATDRLGGRQLLGDDLFATDAMRLRRGIAEQVANAVLVKPNQAGTVSDAHAVVRLARAARYRTVLSARSGDTEDGWLADLAVGWRTGQIKVGSTTRSERTAKWNRLLQIESRLGDRAEFAGWPG